MVPEASAKMLYNVPKHQKAVMCFMEKIHGLGKLFSACVECSLLAVSSMFMGQQRY